MLNQRYPKLEYIIIDGGSTDRTLTIIKKYEKFLTYWLSKSDNSLSEALNYGFFRSVGSIMGWLNSSDILHKGGLSIIAEIFMKNSKVQWITGQNNIIDENERIVRVDPLKIWNYTDFLGGDCRYINQPSTYWRCTLWEKSGPYISQKYQQAIDFELWVRFFQHACLYSISGLIGAHRYHTNQLSYQNRSQYEAEIELILESAHKKQPTLANTKSKGYLRFTRNYGYVLKEFSKA